MYYTTILIQWSHKINRWYFPPTYVPKIPINEDPKLLTCLLENHALPHWYSMKLVNGYVRRLTVNWCHERIHFQYEGSESSMLIIPTDTSNFRSLHDFWKKKMTIKMHHYWYPYKYMTNNKQKLYKTIDFFWPGKSVYYGIWINSLSCNFLFKLGLILMNV